MFLFAHKLSAWKGTHGRFLKVWVTEHRSPKNRVYFSEKISKIGKGQNLFFYFVFFILIENIEHYFKSQPMAFLWSQPEFLDPFALSYFGCFSDLFFCVYVKKEFSDFFFFFNI